MTGPQEPRETERSDVDQEAREALRQVIGERLSTVNFEPVGTGLSVSLFKSERDYLAEILADAILAAPSDPARQVDEGDGTT